MAVSARKREEPRTEVGPIQFLREVIDELRKVVWPTGPELYRYTLVVLFTVAVLGLFIGGADYLLSAIGQHTIYNTPH
ncbi:MAG: preprotein translocase subunit SecE [Candidatus Dormibacterales bacterium]